MNELGLFFSPNGFACQKIRKAYVVIPAPPLIYKHRHSFVGMRGLIDALAENLRDSLEVNVNMTSPWLESRVRQVLLFYAISLLFFLLMLLLQ
ncbi:MAG: hypothetical protein DRN21_05810 [Thermoplasmata archaeon]|nr:MAG: hypothetical protein DRN21_05810 [Thermoplasmata archaeon]